MAEVQEQMDRLNAVRKKAEDVDREKSRISGELGSHKKRQGELAKKCKDEFDCKVEELPELVKDLEEQAEKSLQQAEVVLGLREGEAEDEKEQPAKEAAPEPKKETPKAKSEVEAALDDEIGDEDEDGLF